MTAWTEEVIAGLGGARSVDDAFRYVGLGARMLGFEHCAFGLRLPVPFTRRNTVMLNDYDARWNRRYTEAGYLSVDPTVRHGAKCAAPLVWSDEVFRIAPQFWSEARSFGLCFGWAQSCFDASGRVGMLSLARSAEAITKAELASHDPLLRWLANVTSIAMTRLIDALGSADAICLTERQTEIMQWIADGKTSAEVALILGISVDTVNFHVKNVSDRLHANNRSSAVARSVRLGLLA